ncbi:MAG TPA: O-antigen ligase family protein [Terriglobia bacterium]|nr:O-antigen ligase family protein [Terriglobia bacterium]
MILVLVIDVLVISTLVWVALTRGLERALPFAAFVLVLVPRQSNIAVPGLPDVTTARLTVLSLALLYVVFGRAQSTTRSAGRPALAILILADLAWLATSTADSVVPLVSFKALLSQALDFFLVYYIFFKAATDLNTIRRILGGIVSAIGVCCILGYFEAYHQWTVMQYFPAITDLAGSSSQGLAVGLGRGLRIRSTFPHPILFGAALAFAIPLTLYLIKTAQSRAGKIILWASLMLMFMNIYKTASRGPWLALIISMALLVIFSRSEVRKYIVWLAVLSAFVLIVRPGVWDTIKSDYDATLVPDSPEGESYQYRYELLHLATRRIGGDLDRALWGYGPESFFDLHLQGVNPDTGNSFTYVSCDSAVAELMIETGYVGFVLVVLMLLKMAKIAFSGYRSLPPPYGELSLSFFIVIAAFCFMMTNVAIYGWGQQSYFLWIVFALSEVLPSCVPEEPPITSRAVTPQGELVAAAHAS